MDCDSSCAREGIKKHLVAHRQRRDAFLFKLNAHTQQLELSYIGQSVFCVSSETGDGFRDDEVNLLELTHADHPLKFITGFAFHSSEPFIGEDVHQFPIVACSDAFFVCSDLCGIGVELISGVGRHSAVSCNLHLLRALSCDRGDEPHFRHFGVLLSRFLVGIII